MMLVQYVELIVSKGVGRKISGRGATFLLDAQY